MSTVSDLCTAALQRLGVVTAGTTASSEDLALALVRLNVVKSSWKTQKLFTYALVRTTFAIAANDGIYTIGSGGDINIARPARPPVIRLIDTTASPVEEMTIVSLSDLAYAGLPQKALTSTWPTHVWYNPTSPLGTLTFWPVPTASTLQGVVYTPNDSAVLAFTDVLQLPDGYELFYQENLAVHLAPDFDREPSRVLLQSARDSEQAIKTANLRLADLTVLTPFGPYGQYDINSDGVL